MKARTFQDKEEPSMDSEQPNERHEQRPQEQLSLWEEFVTKSQDIPRDDSEGACIEKSALDENHALIEQIVDEVNLETAWARVKANRGAPGPDGVSIQEFPEWFRPQRETIRRQLLDGTYRPQPARRVTIDKPGGGTRELGIPNVLDRVIQTAIVLALTPIFDLDFSESSFGYRPYRSAQDAVKQVQQIKELEKRELPFVRYADDFVIFTKSEAAARRVCASIERFLTERLKLAVNHDKSRIRKADGLELVGYEFRGYGGQIRVSERKLATFKRRASEIFRRNRGVLMQQRYAQYRSYAWGWLSYFALDQVKTTFVDLDKWVRRRVRACYWKQWRKSAIRLRELVSRGVSPRVARGFAMSGKGPWRLSTTSGVQRALSIEVLTTEGLLNLEELWLSFASLRRTAQC
ncbi:MAG: reverse transcriptase domain-containing protein [Planctomycetota bacterium]